MTANLSVLVTEDDEDLRFLCQMQLEIGGFRVMEAAHGEEALRVARHERPDVILLDLMMPEMDGFTFLNELRKDSTLRSVPVVVVTAKTLTAEERQELSGVIKVLQKGSYDREQLLNEVRALLAAHRKHTEANVPAGA